MLPRYYRRNYDADNPVAPLENLTWFETPHM